MSSAVPIHPLTRIIRQQVAANSIRAARRQAIDRRWQVIRLASGRSKSQTKQGAGSGSISASPSSSYQSSTASTDSSAAARAYAISSRRRQEAQSDIKVSDKRSPNTSPPSDKKKGSKGDAENVEVQGSSSVGGEAQKMLGEGGTRSVKADVSTPPIEGETVDKGKITQKQAALPYSQSKNPVAQSSTSSSSAATDSRDSNKNEVLTDGVIVSKSGDSRNESNSQNFPFSSAFAQSANNPNAEAGAERSSGRSDEANTASNTSQENNDQIRRHLILYPFNTHDFIKRLQDAGFLSQMKVDSTSQAKSDETSLSMNKRHDPAEAIMDALQRFLVSRGQDVVDNNVNKTEVENQAYLFTAALAELRTELQVMARNDAAALRSMVTLLQREVDGLNQRMREDVAGMKHDIQVDMNNRKSEAKEEQNALDQEIQDLNNRFTISISDLKTEIEQSIKWDATRRALTIFFGCIVILIATLTAADYLTRDDVEHAHNSGKAGAAIKEEPKELKAKSAEELGIVANYDEDHGSRYV